MNIVIAPDSFKGSLSAKDVARVMSQAVGSALPGAQCFEIPMADGGEGTLSAMVHATQGRIEWCQVRGPLGDPIDAGYGVLGDGQTVVIEMAEAAGLTLVPDAVKNPMKASTYGVGELLNDALDNGFRNFVIGIGGSATNDGGMGLLNALGARFYDDGDQLLDSTAAAMLNVRRVDLSQLDSRLKASTIRVACDVDNPLTGPRGASAVFGPQKGADETMVAQLDAGLRAFAAVVESAFTKPGLRDTPGAGAAGGLGFALLALGADLVSGAQLIGDACQLETAIATADWVLTGEGRSDAQTLGGKVPYYVASLCKRYGKPVSLVSGSFDGHSNELANCFTSLHACVCGPTSLQAAMDAAESSLFTVTKNIAKLVQIGGSI